jgi:hypothetical protein
MRQVRQTRQTRASPAAHGTAPPLAACCSDACRRRRRRPMHLGQHRRRLLLAAAAPAPPPPLASPRWRCRGGRAAPARGCPRRVRRLPPPGACRRGLAQLPAGTALRLSHARRRRGAALAGRAGGRRRPARNLCGRRGKGGGGGVRARRACVWGVGEAGPGGGQMRAWGGALGAASRLPLADALLPRVARAGAQAACSAQWRTFYSATCDSQAKVPPPPLTKTTHRPPRNKNNKMK